MIDALFLLVEFSLFGLLLFAIRRPLARGQKKNLGFFSFTEVAPSTVTEELKKPKSKRHA